MDLLPPGIPKVDAEEILPELVAYLHDEQTAYGRDVIAWYIEHNDDVGQAYRDLQGLATLMAHLPAVTPSRKFVRRVVRELPRLKAQGRLTRRLETSVLRVHWTIEDWVVYTGEYVAYRLKQHPAQMLATAAALLLLLGGALLVPLQWTESTPAPVAVDEPILPSPETAGGPSAQPAAPNYVERPSSTSPQPPQVPTPPPDDPQVNPNEEPETPLPSAWEPEDVVSPETPTDSQDVIRESANRVGPLLPENPDGEVLPGVSRTGVTNPFRMRNRDDRIRGVTPEMREALDLGIGWLIDVQWPDGAWRMEPASPDATADSSQPVDAQTLQLTAQGCLALLGEGYSSRMPDPARGVPREVRDRLVAGRRALYMGLTFLANHQREDGALLPPERRDLDNHVLWPADAVTIHAQATLALLEDFVLCENYRLRGAIHAAISWLVQHRHIDGGWSPTPGEAHAQLEPTFWAILSLKVARLFTATTDPEFAFDRAFVPAEHFLAACTRQEVAGDTTAPIEPSPYVADTVNGDFVRGHLRPTAIGLALSYVLQEEFVAGDRLAQARTLFAEPLEWQSSPGFDLTCALSGTMAYASSRPDREVRELLDAWHESITRELLAAQVRPPERDRDVDPELVPWLGSWTPTGTANRGMGNVQATALAVLTLQNVYRFRWDAE